VSRVNQVSSRARGMLAGFSPGQRGVIVIGAIALVLGALALSRWAAQPTWSPLFTNLSGSDASAIVEQLKTDGVQYQLSNGGTSVMVPQAQVYDLRVSMSGKGLPSGGGTSGGSGSSYSVLDSQGMTATDFQQNIAYQRALEGELSKTLQAISGVNTAIVHLAIPKKDVFSTDTDRPTAAVLLSLSPGTSLGRAQIRSVMHLVAGSVPGLSASDVTVSDANGALLSVREDGQAGTAAAASETDQQTQQFEDSRGAALQKMFDQVLGVGHAVVRVNAELNFDTKDSTTESYLTQTGISPLSEATSSESYGAGAAGAGGALGQTYPSLTPGVAVGGSGGNYVKIQRTVDNAVGKVVDRVQAAPGSVKRMTVAVVLDSGSKAAANIDPIQIQSLVSQAVGIDQKRGDLVQVNKLAFDTTATAAAAKELAAAQSAAKTTQYLDLGKKAGIGLVLLILAIIALRRRGRNAPTVDAVASDLPETALLRGPVEPPLAISAPAIEALGAGVDILDPTLERDRLRDEVSKFVDQQPEEIAAIVQGWLSQRKS
jgi:flagellar M-ring protein FliF